MAVDQKKVMDKVVQIVCNQLNCSKEKVTPQTDFINDLGADSLDLVELVMAFEEEFDISVPETEAQNIRRVGDAVGHIEKKLEEDGRTY